MQEFTKTKRGNKFIFKDLINEVEISFDCHEEYGYAILYIKEDYRLEFVSYIVSELKKTKDIFWIVALYNSKELEKILDGFGFKIANKEYLVSGMLNSSVDYDVKNIIDDEAKKFSLQKINFIGRINNKYLNPTKDFKEYGEEWMFNKEFSFRCYKKKGKVLGVVDFYVSQEENIIYIRCLFGKTQKIIENIIRLLAKEFQKEMVINCLYTENDLEKVIILLDGIFKCTNYKLVLE